MDFAAKGNRIKNPKQNANFFSRYTMLFTIPLFKAGYERDLELTDLYETLPEHRSDMLGEKIEAAWNLERKNALLQGRTPSLRRVLIKLFSLQFAYYGIMAAFSELFLKMIQPLVLGEVIKYYMPGQKEIAQSQLYLYGSVLILISLVNAFIANPYSMGLVNVGMKIRVSCCSLMYRKALRLDKSTLGQTTIGQIVNLLSNDVNRFDTFAQFVNFLWITPIQILLVTYFVYQQVRLAAIVGTFTMVMFVPLQLFLGNRTSVYRLRTALRTDERIRLMNEIIHGIQVIKMYTWERSFAKLVAYARRFEIKSIRKNAYILGTLSSLNLIMSRISIYATILMYVLYKDNITAIQVFVITAYFNVLKSSVSIYLAYGIGRVYEANISVKRINKFLLFEENNVEVYSNALQVNSKLNEQPVLIINHAIVKWSKNLKENSLCNINLSVKRGTLLGVVGPVGSGKSTLLYTILRELPLITGTLQVNGKLSYASQEPWIFPGSVRQNILFGLPMDHVRYQIVIKKCALKQDLNRFPYGDKTIVGEKGVSLSGGQKARINLARAVYRDADIYLLDDPLSAVDTRVGKQLFEDCIYSFLKGKTVILVTHQLQYLRNIEKILILESGKISAQGSLRELQQSGVDFAKLIGGKEKTQIEEEIKDFSLSHSSRKSSVSFSDGNSIEAPIVEESKSKGTLSINIYKTYFSIGSSCFIIGIVIALFIISQMAGSGGDYYLSYWVNQDQQLSRKFLSSLEAGNATKEIKFSLLSAKHYIILVNYFTRISIYIYSACMVTLIVFSLVRSFAYYAMCMRSSIKLHDTMFENISRATMTFFNVNTSGRILNRFSKDMGSVDELLPTNMMDTITTALVVLGVIIVVAMVIPMLLIPTFIFGYIFYKIRSFYLATSSNVKRLEGITKSPVFAYMASSIQGLSTLRAYGIQDLLKKEFDSHQDLHSSAWHLYLVTSRAFAFSLDLLCAFYIGVVTSSFMIFSSNQFGGNVGLAITQALGLTGMLQWGVRQSTEMVNQMTSVERILEFTNIEEEPPLESEPDLKPINSWPNKGKIKFVDLELRYFKSEPPVLKKLNFTIQPKEKVGIVGRTGAGKSSLIAALFRLAETEGFIVIDDVIIQRIGLHDLRSKISIIPQDPVLFSGTLRRNLDPFDEFSDAMLWKALEEVELKEAVEELVLGLYTKMSEGGTNFSVGQRQLVCLARTVIRNNKILILDEATANVDPQTDALIQTTIRKKFSNCTVLTIAHRLHTVMDSDKIMVMDEGRLVEFGHPHELLENSMGYFYKMVEQTGKEMAEVLKKISKKKFDSFIEQVSHKP